MKAPTAIDRMARHGVWAFALGIAVVIALPACLRSYAGEKERDKGPASESPSSDRRPAAAPPGSWPLFRGDPQFHAFRDVAIARTPELVWTYDTKSEVESTAAIVGGRAFLGTREGDLLALELHPESEDGRLSWKFKAEGGIRSSPGFHDGKLYFGDDYGYFHAVDAKTGRKVWTHDTQGSEIISSANFHEGRVIFGSYDSFLYCLDAATGDVVWKQMTGGPIHSSPPIAEGKTFVTGCDEFLRVIDAERGREVLAMEMGAYTSATPVIAGSGLYVGTFANEVIAVDWKKGKPLWTYRHARKDFPYSSSAAVAGNRLVVGGRDKLIRCLDLETGKQLWEFPTRARVECSPLIARDRVICGSSDQNLYLLDLASGKELWKYAADGAFLASPALADGRLVIGADNGLVYCFDVSRDEEGGDRPAVDSR